MKNELLNSIDEIHEEMKSLTKAGSCGEYAGEAEYSDTKGIVDSVLKSPIIGSLLNLFWQRTSDGCPLECSEHDKECLKWEEWIKTIDFDALIEIADKLSPRYCMPDGINSKEEHEEYLRAIGYKKFEKCISCEFIACENHNSCLKDRM